jgi:pimeloyl-ACP methyl ester carboxylesterase
MYIDSSGDDSAVRFTRRRLLGAAAATGAALAVRRPFLAAAWPRGAAPAAGDFSGPVDIGGRALWLERHGDGGPTVVLEAGAGNNALIWREDLVSATWAPPATPRTTVLPGVAAFTRVCSYDRPGTLLDLDHRSRSDPAPMPRTAAAMVADLRALLAAADVPGPYVLVGHSFGGLIGRLYASTYPEEIVGLVLVDAAHEDYYARMRAVLTTDQWAAASAPPQELAVYPDLERIDADASADQLRAAVAASPLRPLPLVVLTHGLPWSYPPGFPADTLEAVWRSLQDDLAALVPDARLIVAERSAHYIQLDEPGLVIEAVRQVVAAVRDPSTWAT